MFLISDNLKEETLSTNYLYRGRIINVRQDWVKLHNNEKTFREVVEHPGAVAVLALNEHEEVILVRQHRQPAGKILLEIPAGKLEPDELPLECAQRELLEETGLAAGKWNEIYKFYPSPGFCNEVIYLFLAEILNCAVSPTTDPDENIAIVKIPFKKAMSLIESGEIIDGKTIIALQFLMIDKFLTCQ